MANFETQELLSRFGIEKVPELTPRYNIAPGQECPVITDDNPKEISLLRWGLVPSWAKDDKIGYKTINARVETVETKPAFRVPFKRKRCIVIASSFFEWDKHKQPFLFKTKEKIFVFAGLWDEWNGVKTFTIITTQPNKVVGKVHERMPAVLHKKDERKWLEKGDKELLKPYDGELECYPVSKLVGSPANDIPEVIKPHYLDKTLDGF